MSLWINVSNSQKICTLSLKSWVIKWRHYGHVIAIDESRSAIYGDNSGCIYRICLKFWLVAVCDVSLDKIQRQSKRQDSESENDVIDCWRVTTVFFAWIHHIWQKTMFWSYSSKTLTWWWLVMLLWMNIIDSHNFSDWMSQKWRYYLHVTAVDVSTCTIHDDNAMC